MSLCTECKMNTIPSGCGVPIKHIEVKKGIGTVSCSYFMSLNDSRDVYKIKNKLYNK